MTTTSRFTAAPTARRASRSAALLITMLITSAGLGLPSLAVGQQVKVRHSEGLVHGFLALRTLDGATLASGDLIQTAEGSRVASRLIFRFKDGSRHEETTIFSQEDTFKLLSHRLVQQGPSFPRPLDMRIDAAERRVTVRYTDDDGETRVESDDLDSASDLANGLILTLLKNLSPDTAPVTLPMLAATPKPRLVHLEITASGEEQFSTPGATRKAMHYVVKVEIGGLSGVLAPLLGKQPPDSHVWILGGAAPAFVKSEQPLYAGGPVWRIELVSPAWRDPGPER
jgi:hypothetical protein